MVESTQLTLSLGLPQDSVVGHERAPRTAAERQAAAAALARLRDGAALFRPDAAARCTLASAEVSAPLLAPAAAPATPADGHADLDATYVFQCAQPDRLTTVEVLLFDAFPRLDRIAVQAALARGQRKAVLRRSARVLRLGG